MSYKTSLIKRNVLYAFRRLFILVEFYDHIYTLPDYNLYRRRFFFFYYRYFDIVRRIILFFDRIP